MPTVRNMRALIVLAVMAATLSNASPLNIGNGVVCNTKEDGNSHYSSCIKVLSSDEARKELDDSGGAIDVDESFFDYIGSLFRHKHTSPRAINTRGIDECDDDCRRERIRFEEAKKEKDIEADEEIKRKHFAAHKSAEFRKFEKDRRGYDDDCDDECRRERIRFIEAKKEKDIEADEEINRKHFAAHKAAEFRKFEKDRRGFSDDEDECDDECRRERIRFLEAKKEKDVEADEEIKRKHFAAHKAAEFRKFEKDRRGFSDEDECDDECRRERIRFLEAKKEKDVEADEEIKRKHFAAHKVAEFRKFEKDRRGLYDGEDCNYDCHDDDDECFRRLGWYRNGRDCDDECRRERIRFVEAKRVKDIEADEEYRRTHFRAHEAAEIRKFDKERRQFFERERERDIYDHHQDDHHSVVYRAPEGGSALPHGYHAESLRVPEGFGKRHHHDHDYCDEDCRRERVRLEEAKKVEDVEADEEYIRKHFKQHEASEFRKFEKERRQFAGDATAPRPGDGRHEVGRLGQDRGHELHNQDPVRPVQEGSSTREAFRLEREREREVYSHPPPQPIVLEGSRHEATRVEREKEREVYQPGPYSRPLTARGLYDPFDCHDDDDECFRRLGWFRNGRDCDDHCRRERIRFVEAKKVKNIEFDEEIRRKHFKEHKAAEFRKLEKDRRGFSDDEGECDDECRRERIRFLEAKKEKDVEADEEIKRKHFAAHKAAEFRKFEKDRREFSDEDECDDECRRERIRFLEAKKEKDVEADEEIKRKHFAAHKAAEFRKFEKDRRGLYDGEDCNYDCHDDDDECFRRLGWYRNGRDCDDECRRERIRFVEAKRVKDIEADEEYRRSHFRAHEAAEVRKFDKERRSPYGYDDCDDNCRRERLRLEEAKKLKKVEADEEYIRKHYKEHKAEEFRKFEKDRNGNSERIRLEEAKKVKDVEADEEVKRKHFKELKKEEVKKLDKERRGLFDFCDDDCQERSRYSDAPRHSGDRDQYRQTDAPTPYREAERERLQGDYYRGSNNHINNNVDSNRYNQGSPNRNVEGSGHDSHHPQSTRPGDNASSNRHSGQGGAISRLSSEDSPMPSHSKHGDSLSNRIALLEIGL